MGAENEVGVDTTAADRTGTETATLAKRYAGISTSFQAELSLLSEASRNEMPVASGALDYCADIVGQLTALHAHTGTLGTNAVAGAADARRADDEIGTGLASVYAS